MCAKGLSGDWAKKLANILNELAFWTKNSWTFHSLSYLSGLIAFTLTMLQGQRNHGQIQLHSSRHLSRQPSSWDPHSVKVQLMLFLRAQCFLSIKHLILQSYGVKMMITFQILKMAFGSFTHAAFYFEYWEELLFNGDRGGWTRGWPSSLSPIMLCIGHHWLYTQLHANSCHLGQPPFPLCILQR